jgi:tRNA (guanine37-N1)-methyltransferase
MTVFSFQVITLFPELFERFIATSLIGRAVGDGILQFSFINPRDFAADRHRTVDDVPYGGGAGMIMKAEPAKAALAHAGDGHRVLLSPRGKPFKQQDAERLARLNAPLVLFCGRYEGLDERVVSHFHECLSIGDYVLNGGEIGSMVIVEAVSRLLPGVVGNRDSLAEESFSTGLLEYPQYTRPETLCEDSVPPILLSGNHGEIARWRKGQSLLMTYLHRPDLFSAYSMSPEEETLFQNALAEYRK